MTEDAHAQANAEQVRVLREALVGAEQVAAELKARPGVQTLPPAHGDDSPCCCSEN
ncbi:hypothetical protein [Deinococcus apachensis]|uniref:hypothetical protein n=1 Tax=Deinococcus apachensis TaxID=309886 RepID=UPI00039D9FD3|nr:hypothetical protein [Deinococcus apachensis]